MVDLTPYLNASGHRILGGQIGKQHNGAPTGGGVIEILHPARIGIDENLWLILRAVADELKLTIAISSIDTGGHVVNSRHYSGRAVDISRFGSVGGILLPATVRNPHATHFISFLLANGFHVGEGRPWPAVLFGPIRSVFNPSPIDHSDHAHVSLPRRRAK